MGRNSRRQQRLDKEEEEEEEEEHTIHAELSIKHQNTFKSFFGQLTDEQIEPDDDGEDELNADNQGPTDLSTSKKKKKPKKKPKSKSNHKITKFENSTDTPTSIDQIDSKKSLEKKKDEIDQAIIELSEKLPKSISIEQSSGPKTLSTQRDLIIDKFLSIDPRNLDPDLELRRMFGARVISSTSSTHTPMNQIYGPRVSNNPHHQLNTKIKLRSTILCKPNPLWPELDKASMGLSVRKLTQNEIATRRLADSDKWFKFEHSHKFRFYQSRFFLAIDSSDHHRLAQILQSSPYHPDTLLLLSEISAQNDDQSQSIDFVNRALYINEKVLNFKSSSPNKSSSQNSKSVVLGDFRLDFNSAENRNFFRALSFKLKFLVKQGCYKTAFETCKLLFSLNPYKDPYGSLLWIDFLAVKADQHEFFLKFLEHLPYLQLRDPNNGIRVETYPGLHFAKALCMRAIEDANNQSHEGSDSALESAIYRFPQLIKPLAEMIGFSVPSKFEQNKILHLPFTAPANYAHPRTRYVDPHHLIDLSSRIYITRSFSLWKVPNISNWLQSTIIRTVDKCDRFQHIESRMGLLFATQASLYFGSFESIYRSVMASDDDALKRLLPSWVYASLDNFSFTFDPIPPVGADLYDGKYFTNFGEEIVVTLGGSQGGAAARGNVDLADSDSDRDGAIEREERNRDAVIDEREEEGDEEEENSLIFADDFDPTQLDLQTINRLISRIQSSLQINDDQLSTNQRQDLLSRLDALFDRQRALDQQQELDTTTTQSDPIDFDQEPNEFQADLQELSFDHSHQMPGSFFNPPP